MLLHPDKKFVNFLISGLREGFDIGYSGPEQNRISRNLVSAVQNSSVIDEYLKTEVSGGRIHGPFLYPPFDHFQCNPIGVVPKKTPGKFRVIMDLSYPPGNSINDYIDKEEFSLRYVTTDTAVKFIQARGPGCFLSKIDIAQAFRLIPVAPSCWSLLGIFWENRYYFDTRLSMGGRSSPSLFNNLPEAIEWVLKNNYDLDMVCHLLDDFLGVEDPNEKGIAIDIMTKLFKRLGVPLAPDKIEGPLTV